MTTTCTYPSVQDLQRPPALSEESKHLKESARRAQVLFLNGSIFIQGMLQMDFRDKFQALKSSWLDGTKYFSDSTDISNHPAYRLIIRMGPEVVPLIIDDLMREDHHWFEALTEITGQDPVKEEHWGMIQLMKEDWLEWARANHITNAPN